MYFVTVTWEDDDGAGRTGVADAKWQSVYSLDF